MRRFLLTFAVVLAASAAAIDSVAAQAAPAAAPSADEQAVRAVLQKLFDGMRTRDTAMMKSVFAEQARLYGVGRTGISVSTPDEFVTGIAAAPAGMKLDEVLHDIEVRIDGALANVWTYYDFFAGDNFSHCGYDALQLLKVGPDWKIVALSDSRRREGCKQKR